MHLTQQLLAVRWREPEVVAMDTPAHLTTPVTRSFSHRSSRSSVSVSSNSEQLQLEEEKRDEEEGEREERAEQSSENQEELPPSPPTTPQLLLETITTSLKKVC